MVIRKGEQIGGEGVKVLMFRVTAGIEGLATIDMFVFVVLGHRSKPFLGQEEFGLGPGQANQPSSAVAPGFSALQAQAAHQFLNRTNGIGQDLFVKE